jgi:hypothetical protein
MKYKITPPIPIAHHMVTSFECVEKGATPSCRGDRLVKAPGRHRGVHRPSVASVSFGRPARGHALRALHAENKAARLRELADERGLRELADERGYDLDECTAYSDSHTDVPFLEAVGTRWR